MIKYSIIIPFYNVKDYIVECAKSIHNQTYKNFEALFVDDGSKDESRVILEEYLNEIKDSRFKMFTKKNGGLSDARNYGLKNAKGKYIFFIDSDDFIDDNTLKEIDKKILADKPDILIFDFYEYFNKDKKNKQFGLKKVDTNDIIKRCLISPPAAWNKIYKRDLLIKNDINYPIGLWYEDLATTPRIYPLCKKISYLPLPLYFYRQRQGSIMNSFSEKVFNMYEVLKIVYDYYEKNNLLEKYYYEIERLFIYNCFFIVHKLGYSDYKEKLSKELEAIDFLENYFKTWNKNPYLKKEKTLTRIHIKIMKHKRLLPIYNKLRGKKK